LHDNFISNINNIGQEKSPTIACKYGVPQGAVLGSLLYTLYVAPIAGIIASFNINHLQYADDTQLYMALDGTNVSTGLDNCLKTVKEWFALTACCSIQTNPRLLHSALIPLLCPRAPVVLVLDNTLSFNTHINEMCKSVRYHTRGLRHVRKYVSTDDAKQITAAMVLVRLNYCNSILYKKQTSLKLRRSKTVWLVSSPELENEITLPRSQPIYIGC